MKSEKLSKLAILKQTIKEQEEEVGRLQHLCSRGNHEANGNYYEAKWKLDHMKYEYENIEENLNFFENFKYDKDYRDAVIILGAFAGVLATGFGWGIYDNIKNPDPWDKNYKAAPEPVQTTVTDEIGRCHACGEPVLTSDLHDNVESITIDDVTFTNERER